MLTHDVIFETASGNRDRKPGGLALYTSSRPHHKVGGALSSSNVIGKLYLNTVLDSSNG